MRFIQRFIFTILVLPIHFVFGQSHVITGKVIDADGEQIPYAGIRIAQERFRCDDQGAFFIDREGREQDTLVVYAMGYVTDTILVNYPVVSPLIIPLTFFSKILDNAEILVKKKPFETTFNPEEVRYTASPFQDISSLLATMPGVIVTNELSSMYAVRGGSYDENLVYVNNIPVYRPFLVRNPQQDGLGFVNPDLTSNVNFYAGGWDAQYGDKLGSVLSVKYKQPTETKGSVSYGLLGGSGHIEGVSKNKRLTHLIGVRHKQARFLLNNLETQGQYFPNFVDIQYMGTYDLNPEKKNSAKLSWLYAYARNRFQLIPETRKTRFGTRFTMVEMNVAYRGQENMLYDTHQGAIKLTKQYNKKWFADTWVSFVSSYEREMTDLEAYFRICDTSPDVSPSDINACLLNRNLAMNYDYSRNQLDVNIATGGYDAHYRTDDHEIDLGFLVSGEQISDVLSEYSFIDSAGYPEITQQSYNQASLNSMRLNAYGSYSYVKNKNYHFTTGLRLGYWSLNQRLTVSPRLQMLINPESKERYRVSLGLYQQPPFYREMRNFRGDVNTQLKEQSALQLSLAREKELEMYNRPFRFTTEIYAKYLYNVIPYDLYNLKIRYYGENSATAYVIGTDMRFGGEFIRGEESWFSLGVMSARENVEGDGRGYIRRPMDQRVTFGIHFQDHLPNDPSFKVNLNMMFGTGLPFGPPASPEYRNALKAPMYRRVDLSLSKMIVFNEKSIMNKNIESVWIAVEALNLLGSQNVMSFLWINDPFGSQYAVPNYLTQRFLNVRVVVKY